MLNYTDSLSTLQDHLPRPGPTISSSGLSPASALPRCRVHKWGGMPPFLIWLTSNSSFSLLASSTATTRGYPQSSPAPSVSIIHVICLAARLWNPYRTLSIAAVTTQLSLPYSSTAWATALYIIPQARTVATAFANTLSITPHCLRAFFRF